MAKQWRKYIFIFKNTQNCVVLKDEMHRGNNENENCFFLIFHSTFVAQMNFTNEKKS